MSIKAALTSAMETVPDCVAAGYVDMETGILLGMKSSSGSQDEMEKLAMAVANLFQGRGIKAFEELMCKAGVQDSEEPGFGEIAVFSNDRLFVFLRTQKYPEHVVCYICKDSTTVGLALTKSHLSLGSVTAAV